MDGVLAWLAAHQVFAVAITTVVAVTVTAVVKSTRRLWILGLGHVGRGLQWIGSYRVVHKSRVRPRKPPFIAPVRLMAGLGPKSGEATLVNTASGVAKNLQVDSGYNVKIVGDAQWSVFPGKASFKCIVEERADYHDVEVSWLDELGEPQHETVRVVPRYSFAT